MTHREKIDHLIEELRKRRVNPYAVAPPAFRLLWAIGLKVPPPFFLGFFSLAFSMGILFAVSWGILMWLFLWRRAQNVPTEVFIITSIIAGVVFGISMAFYYRWKAKKLNLPSWDKYPGE
jgi:hypothetical protein